MFKFSSGITGEGITLRFGLSELHVLTPDPTCSQTSPRSNYVYGHRSPQGTLFYVGKGCGRRAWDDSRHALWHRYVQNHLGGTYTVQILADNLSSDEAEALESEWIAQESETLVNWINFGRKTDFALLDRYRTLRDANRTLMASARTLEKDRTEEAIGIYRRVIDNIAAYASIQPEKGLVGQLLDEELSEVGHSGEIAALDRLTLCLTRIGRVDEAAAAAAAYFAHYRADAHSRPAAAIQKRVSKGGRDAL